jgi:hypothetical protein
MAAVLKAIADLNVSPFDAAMGRIEKRVDKFASGNMAAIGRTIGAAFSVYAVTRFVGSVGDAAHGLQSLSNTTGASAENLQALQILFQKNGKEAGDVASRLAILKKNMAEATVSPHIAQSFQKLGIAFDDVASKSPDRILEQIAKAMRAQAGDMAANEAAGNLLGVGYANLQGVMNALAAQGLDPLRESLRSTNEIMTNESVAAAAKMQEAYEKLGRQMKTTASNKVIEFFGGLKALGVAIGSGGDWNKAAESLFGPTPEATPALAAKRDSDARKASAQAMQRAAEENAGAKRAAAQDWFAEQTSKISVGNVQAADALARTGGYVGGQTNPAASVAERQLKVMELQRQLEERIAKATEEAAAAGKQTVAALED